MVNIKLSEHGWDGSIVAVVLEECAPQLSSLQILADGGGLQDPLGMFMYKVQIDISGITSFVLLVAMSDEGDNINLPVYFIKALQAAGWDEARPIILTWENKVWNLRACKSWVAM